MRNRLLVDGNNLWKRSIYAARGKDVGYGHNAGALTIAINLLARYCRTIDPEEIMVAWDAGYSFRKSVMPEYKSNRPISDETPGYESEFAALLASAGIHQAHIPGWEADDLIGWASRNTAESPTTTYILSGDKDLMQLVNNHVQIIRIPDTASMTAYDVEKKTGVAPENLRYYLALVGDTADNVKGVTGLGPKRAIRALSDANWDFYGFVSTLAPERQREAIQSLLVVDLMSDDIYPAEQFGGIQAMPVPRDENGRKFPLTQNAYEYLTDRGFVSTIDKWRSGNLWTDGSNESLWQGFDF